MKQYLCNALALVGLTVVAPSLPAIAQTPTTAIGGDFQPDDFPVSDDPYRSNHRVVIGSDDRKPVLNLVYPYSTIGRIDWVSGDGTVFAWCTGTLIGPDLVLTNSHCLTNPRTDTIVNSQRYSRGRDRIVFKPGLIQGEAVAEATVLSYRYGWETVPEEAAEDWALLKIDQPLGEEFGYLGWRDLDFTDEAIRNAVEGKLRNAGYAGDYPTENNLEFGESGDTAGLTEGCSIIEAHNHGRLAGLVFHECDTNPGSSGSALFARFDDGRYSILGLHAGSNRLFIDATLPSGETTQYFNRAVQVNRWSRHAAEMR